MMALRQINMTRTVANPVGDHDDACLTMDRTLRFVRYAGQYHLTKTRIELGWRTVWAIIPFIFADDAVARMS